tara:strand:- start:18178 stop:19509 length:1332 start_codon:yes stop_codon:yes gene_type:complete
MNDIKITMEYLNRIGEELRVAVIGTLDLSESEQVFIGNEEKLFLLELFKRIDKNTITASGADLSLNNFKEKTFNRMYDIFKGEIAIRETVRTKVLKIITFVRSLLFFLRSLFFLRKSDTIIHSHAYFRNRIFVIEDLSFFLLRYEKKCPKVRERFRNELIKTSMDEKLIGALVELFPSSHMESYAKIKNHYLSKINIKKVVTSIYGVMADPLLGSIIRNNKSDLYYIQHGGGYGLNDKRVEYQLEDSGCKTMYYWGTGKQNIYPSRYKDKSFPKMNSEIQFILSANKNRDKKSRDYYIATAEELESIFRDVSIVAFPNADKKNFTYKNMKYGISPREHQKSKLIIYDSVGQSLLFSRILSRRPFLVVDDFITDANNSNAKKFLKLLKECNLLLSREDLLNRALFWSSMSEDILVKEFIKSAEPFLNHVLDQPKLEETFIYNKR